MDRKEAIEVIKKNWPDNSFTGLCEALETLIPELMGSKDEKIKKQIIYAIKELPVCDETKRECIDWLEKQGQVKDSTISKHENKTCKENDDSLTGDDDRIRKELIFYLGDMPEDTELRNGVTNRDVLAWLEKRGEQSFSNTRQECLKGIKRVRECQDLSDWEKKFDNIASLYAFNKNQEGYDEPWYVKERAAAMLYHAKKELEKKSEQKPADKVESKFYEGD